MVLPAVPVPCTVMLVSLLMPSVDAPAVPSPVSLAEANVGAAGAAEGAALANVNVTALLAALRLPAMSVCLAVKTCAPLLSAVGKFQVVPLAMTVLPIDVAPENTSMVAPNSPVPEMTGLAATAPVGVVMVGALTALSIDTTKLLLTKEVAAPTV